MFDQLNRINQKPAPFSVYTAETLWTDPYLSAKMLQYHLNGAVDLASRSTAFLDRSAAWITEQFALGAQTRVADFGCGPGLNAIRLARAGAQVTGIDWSARSLAYARDAASAKGLAIEYVHANYLAWEPSGPFDLILLIMCDYGVLSPEQRQTLLRRFRSCLAPGGAVLLDVQSLAALARREECAGYEKDQLDGFWSPDPYYAFTNTFVYPAAAVVLDRYWIVEAERERRIYNWFQYFSPETLRHEFAEAGFVIETVWGDVAGAVYDPDADGFAVIARLS